MPPRPLEDRVGGGHVREGGGGGYSPCNKELPDGCLIF
jgi:hypothetical protein